MKRQVRVAYIVPAGPRDDVVDTVASIVQYGDPSKVVIVVDDCGLLAGDGAQRLSALSPVVEVLPAAAAPPGPFGGLWVKLSAAYRSILGRYEPGLVVRLDTDALMIGAGIERLAEDVFAAHPEVGQLGAYKLGPDDGPRDFAWPAGELRRSIGPLGLVRPGRRAALRYYYRLARANGYVAGDHALGGSYIHRFEAVKTIYDRGWFDDARRLRRNTIGEDHMMGLLTMAAGYRIGDFSRSSDPMALTWVGLPAHPDELLARGKLITHSVRSWQDLTEREIRGIFAAARAKDLPAQGAAPLGGAAR